MFNRQIGKFVVCAFLAASNMAWPQQVSKDAAEWTTYSGNDAGWRYSPLDQINSSNVRTLTPNWVFQSGDVGKFETTPLVVNGILYGTAQNNRSFALDPVTGKAIWRASRSLPRDLRVCCGNVNRGFAIQGKRLIMTTLDAHVVAMDSRTGTVLWDTKAADYTEGYSFTVAPLLVKDKVIVGVSGGEFPIRGFIDAYSVETGKLAWRFYTIPGPGERGHESWSDASWKTGGAPAWVTGVYDAMLNLVYWGTGNPAPSNYGGQREGDNLYSNSVVALDADTGKLKWHFQFTPHDLFDYDATQTPVLIDATWKGEPRKLLLQANRNSFFYALDRTNGQFLFAKSFASQNWAKEIGSDGRPVPNPGTIPTREGTTICPGWAGGVNWNPPSYSPQSKLFYVNAREDFCTIFGGNPETPVAGRYFYGSTFGTPAGQKDWGALRAIDPLTGDRKWEFKLHSAGWGGVLSTAGGLVFLGDNEGNFMAFDAATGRHLWHFQLGSPVFGAPMSYFIAGKQHIAIPAGSALFDFTLPDR